MTTIKRGALVVLEGCDKVGKSTQAKLLAKALENEGYPSTLMRFPDRSTETGKHIDSYLRNSKNLEDDVIHKLFSENRWEVEPKMRELLNRGVTLVVDRYAFSGVAFTAAKNKFSIDWCKKFDVGLPKPDIVLYFNGSLDKLKYRSAYGEERYEDLDFQQRVRGIFSMIEDDTFKNIDADQTIDDVHQKVMSIVIESMPAFQCSPISKLWESSTLLNETEKC